jgi:hypothetical protein
MPQVKVDGKVKKFAYTPEGMDKAKRMALRTGGKMKKRKKSAVNVGKRAVGEGTAETSSQLAQNTLLNTYRKTKNNAVKQHPVTGLDYMRVPELEHDRQKRLKQEKIRKYKAGAKKRADVLRAKNPDAHHWKKKN